MTSVGTVLDGKYEILKQIGQGGMSVVYVAMDLRLNKQWAVKEIKNDGTKNVKMLLKGLETEANILAKVDHPVLPRIVDIIEKDEKIYVIMDYIEGKPLNIVLDSKGAQSQERVVEWARQLCSALNYLHSLKPPIIYRDMKPSNIMLKPDGTIKLIDFGIAKEYKSGKRADTSALGTRGYAAPEQFGDVNGHGIHKTDSRTDIYCLGATMYHLLTGVNPSDPPFALKPIRQWNPMLSSGLEKIIKICTQADPVDRYQNCSELQYALEHYNELDNSYKRSQIKKLLLFCGSIVATISFILITIWGTKLYKKDVQENYRNLILQANESKIDGNYREAASLYIDAISNVDGENSEAYIELLNLYVNYIDIDEGLNIIERYIDSSYNNVDKNNDVLFSVAITYYDKVGDYKSALKYFRMIDEQDKDYTFIRYYKAITTYLTALDCDYESLQTKLYEFEIYNDENISDKDTKIINYHTICKIYSSNIGEISDAPDNTVAVANKALSCMEDKEEAYGEDYYRDFYRFLAIAYSQKGDLAVADNKIEAANENYELAISNSLLVLDYTFAGEDDLIRSEKICDIAKLYQKLGDNEKAIEWYTTGESEYGTKSYAADIYIGHLSLLCDIQKESNNDIEFWDFSLFQEVYDCAAKVENINDDIRWKRLKQKLEPLLSKNGR